jgi:hypothetical protein
MSRIFISYAEKDQPFVQRLTEALSSHGHEVRSWASIAPGDDWLKTLGDFIRRADAHLVVLTPGYVASPFSRSEFESLRAMKRTGAATIPLLVEKVDAPTWLGGNNAIEFKDFDTGFAQLMGVLASLPHDRSPDEAERKDGAGGDAMTDDEIAERLKARGLEEDYLRELLASMGHDPAAGLTVEAVHAIDTASIEARRKAAIRTLRRSVWNPAEYSQEAAAVMTIAGALAKLDGSDEISPEHMTWAVLERGQATVSSRPAARFIFETLLSATSFERYQRDLRDRFPEYDRRKGLPKAGVTQRLNRDAAETVAGARRIGHATATGGRIGSRHLVAALLVLSVGEKAPPLAALVEGLGIPYAQLVPSFVAFIAESYGDPNPAWTVILAKRWTLAELSVLASSAARGSATPGPDPRPERTRVASTAASGSTIRTPPADRQQQPAAVDVPQNPDEEQFSRPPTHTEGSGVPPIEYLGAAYRGPAPGSEAGNPDASDATINAGGHGAQASTRAPSSAGRISGAAATTGSEVASNEGGATGETAASGPGEAAQRPATDATGTADGTAQGSESAAGTPPAATPDGNTDASGETGAAAPAEGQAAGTDSANASAESASPQPEAGGSGEPTPAVAGTPSSEPPRPRVDPLTFPRASTSDQPAAKDELGFEPYVEAVAAFLKNDGTQPPLTLSIEGEWGSGKSSFMRQLQEEIEALPEGREPSAPTRLQRTMASLARLRKRRGSDSQESADDPEKRPRDPSVITVWFNPWRHDREEAVWAAFALEFLRAVTVKLPLRDRWRGHWKLLWKRFSWRDGWLDALRALAAGIGGLVLVSVLVYVTATTPLLTLFAAQLAGEEPAKTTHPSSNHQAPSAKPGTRTTATPSAPAAAATPAQTPPAQNAQNATPNARPATASAQVATPNAQSTDAKAEAKDADKKDPEQALIEILLRLGGVGASMAVALSFLKQAKAFVGNPLRFDLRKYVSTPDYQSRISFIEHFHRDFGHIVRSYVGERRVYVFVDDLDRCDVPKAADLMQALNLLVGVDEQPIFFVLGMDREKIAASLAVKFKELLPYVTADSRSAPASAATVAPPSAAAIEGAVAALRGLEYGSDFIEKFVQVSFMVPQPREQDVARLLDSMSERVAARREAATAAKRAQTQTAESSSPSPERRQIALGSAIPVTPPPAAGVASPSSAETNGDHAADADGGGGEAEVLERRTGDATVEQTGSQGESGFDIAPAYAEAAYQLGVSARAARLDREARERADEERRAREVQREREAAAEEEVAVDSPRLRKIALAVAPALENNPRRIKQFVNVFRLRAFIASRTGLIRDDGLAGLEDLTYEKLGKFIAISLRWPMLVAALQDDPGLLGQLQKRAIFGVAWKVDSPWTARGRLMDLLRTGVVFPDGSSDVQQSPIWSLEDLNVDVLLQVAAPVRRTEPAIDPAAVAPQPVVV